VCDGVGVVWCCGVRADYEVIRYVKDEHGKRLLATSAKAIGQVYMASLFTSRDAVRLAPLPPCLLLLWAGRMMQLPRATMTPARHLTAHDDTTRAQTPTGHSFAEDSGAATRRRVC
jgi:hypothetical protein